MHDALQALKLHSTQWYRQCSFNFFSSCFIVSDLGPEELVGGDMEMAVKLVWLLIERYHLGKCNNAATKLKDPEREMIKYGDTPVEKSILGWINAVLPNALQATNLTTDWKDGIRLSALVNALSPGVIPDYEDLDPSNALENTRAAMKQAEAFFRVPQVRMPVWA